MSEYLAKPTGILLEDHVQHVRDEAAILVAAHPFIIKKYQTTGQNLAELLDKACLWHDEGKKAETWKNACQKDYQAFQEAQKQGENLRSEHLRKLRFRHEIASLEIIQRRKILLEREVEVAIAAHHGKLGMRYEKRWREDSPHFEKFWNMFEAESQTIKTYDARGLEKAVFKRYKFDGIRSLLQLADHRASAIEEGEQVPCLHSFSYKFPHKEKRGVQKIIEQCWDEPFALLRAPTGAGKTDAALLWAQRQIEQGRADRLVIVMPTRFTANALAVNAAEHLSATGIYHSSSWFKALEGKITSAEFALTLKEQDLARRLATPVTVTTIDHLCTCLAATREYHHATFFNLAHSCVVIDEADFYDEFTQHNILVLLQALKVLNVPVLLMSATLPDSVRTFYAQSGFEVQKIFEDTSKNNVERYRLIYHDVPVTNPNDIALLLQRALAGEPCIIYVNTVRRAQEYYRWFRNTIDVESATTSLQKDDIVVYHSRFTEPHKAAIESKLLGMLGKDAWEHKTQKGVVILTQIGELSVNISANLMISEICPLDRLAQRAGRLSRFGGIGELIIIEPHRVSKKGESQFSPAPYFLSESSREPSHALEDSRHLLREFLQENRGISDATSCTPKTFIDLVNKLYSIIECPEQRVLDNKRDLEQLIVMNWLILPDVRRPDEQDDEGRSGEWRSRDIRPTLTIYANVDFEYMNERFFRTWREFRSFQLQHGIQCRGYEIRAASDRGDAQEVTVSIGEDDQQQIFIVNRQFYNDSIGLSWEGTGEDDDE